MPGRIRWIFSGAGIPILHERDDPSGHGSCVAPKATDVQFGTAKKSDLVVVKAEGGGKQDGTTSLLRGIALAAIDVRDNNLMGKAVLNFSYLVRIDRLPGMGKVPPHDRGYYFTNKPSAQMTLIRYCGGICAECLGSNSSNLM
jgi:hypothetical protein